MLRPLLAVVAALLLAAVAAPTASAAPLAVVPCAGSVLLPTAATVPALRSAILCELNRERTRRGLPALREHHGLRVAAARHSAHMAGARYFAHVAPDGATVTQRAARAGYARSGDVALGENLAWASGPEATPRALVGAWMASPGHRRNVLARRFREIGIGIALGTPAGEPGTTVTTAFGVRGRAARRG